MKALFKYIFIVLFITTIGLLVLDKAYTSVYASNVRDKFQYIRSFKNKEVDYILLGSSRVENGLNPKIIDRITHKKSVNFGVQASGVLDLELLLKLIKDYKIKHKCIYIQMDYIYNLMNKKSNVLEYELAPFVTENQNIESYFNANENGFVINNIPFIRYALYDQKKGLRELIATSIKKSNKVVVNEGFSPLFGTTKFNPRALPDVIVKENPRFEALLRTIKKNQLNVTFFCSPFRSDTKRLDYVQKLKSKIDLIDYSNAIKSDSLFKDGYHLNEKGSEIFSLMFANDLIKENGLK